MISVEETSEKDLNRNKIGEEEEKLISVEEKAKKKLKRKMLLEKENVG